MRSTMHIFDVARRGRSRSVPFLAALLCSALLCTSLVLSGGAALAAGKGKEKEGGEPKQKGEVSVIKRPKVKPADGAAKPGDAPADKGAPGAKKETKKIGPGAPEQRRSREKSSVEDIDDELAILRELLDIERGSETEADTLLEISYVLWDRALAYELEAHDVKLETCLASDDKEDKHRCEIEQQNLLEQSRAAKLDVINHLKRIERAFPKFAKLDEVLYSLAYHLGEIDRPGEAVDAYMRLVRKTPKSTYVPDAFLGIGNYYFSKNNGTEAIKWYTKALDFPDAPVFGWALYYIAWVHYNTQNWKQAVAGFVRVLDYSKHEARGRVTFIEDAGKYLVRSWAEFGNPKEALAFFKRAAEGSEIMLLDMLAQYYSEVSQFAKSNDALDQLIEFAKEDQEMLRFLVLRLENSYKLHDLNETVKSAQMVSNGLKHGFKVSAKRFDDLEMLMAEIATTFHGEYENTQVITTLEMAEKMYRLYGEHFEKGANAYGMLYNHALALFQLKRWTEAAAMYEKVIEVEPTGKFAEPAAHRALVCYINLQDLSSETSEKAQDLTDTRPVPLTPEEEKVARACERYVDTAEKNKIDDEDVPKAMFIAGRLYYQRNQFDKAAAMLGKFVQRYPAHEYAYDGARLMVSALWLGQDGKGLREWVDKLIQDPRFNHDSLGVTITEFKSNEEYNKCIELKDQPVKAAECLVAYANGFKDKNPEKAAQAMSGAARFYRTAKKRDQIIETYRNLATTFPTDKRAPQSLFEIGEIYRESADFRQAADSYEAFVKAFPTHEKVPQALATATRYRELLGDFDKVVEDGELFLTTFSKDKRAAEVAYNVSVQAINKGDWKGVIKASDKFLKRSDNIPLELQLAAMTNTGTAQFKLNMGDRGLALFKKVSDTAEQLQSAGKLAELPTVGRDAIVQALFMRGELEFEKVRALKGAPKNLEAATKLVAEKATKVAEADKVYAEAEAAKNPKWTAAASSRRGRIWQDIATSIKNLPPPPAFKTDELKTEWLQQVSEKAAPLFDRAKERYREALKKAAEIFAFDSYWAEARDNLKTLDGKFAEATDIKEFMVEEGSLKYDDSAKPGDVVKETRYKLFELSTGAAVDESATPAPAQAETTVAANPEMAKAYTRMAFAHFAQGQYREALFSASYGMRNAPELKKSAMLWRILAASYKELGQVRESLVAYEEAGKADEKQVDALLNAAAVTMRYLDFENAVRLLDEVLKRDPENYWAVVTKPVALRRLSDDPAKAKEALAVFDILAEKETRPQLHYNRCVVAQAVLTGGKPELQKALEICQKSLEVVGSKFAKYKELETRVKGLKTTIEFMP